MAYEHHVYNNDREMTQNESFSLAKIFLYMFAGLTITAIIAFGLAAFYRFIFQIDSDLGIDANLENAASLVLIILLILSVIGIIVLSIVVPITVARGRHSVLAPMIIYTILMGIMLSTIAIFVPWYLLGITFFITALIFGFMSLIALLSKSRLNGLVIVAIGLFIGAGLISLFLWILMITLPAGTVTWLYWVVMLAVFAGMMLITIWDIARIKRIAMNGEMTNNLSLYCAFILYNDFINILLRVLRILVLLFGKSK